MFAGRVYERHGWHVELYLGAEALLALKDKILALPKVSIDHLGLQAEGLDTLKALVAQGVYVKATGFGRVDFDPFQVIQELSAINPGALVFGTDLPCTRAPSPFQEEHFYRLGSLLTSDELDQVLWSNALSLYNLMV